jgi:hypothetical protein
VVFKMKAIGPSDLQSALDSDLVWRRKEISDLVAAAKTSETHATTSILRASVPLLYAHWEGFGKECFTRYLEFVSYRRIKFKNLHPAFLYMASYPSLSRVGNVGVKEGLEAIHGFISKSESTNKDHFRKRISTQSNLRADVLESLLLLCGLNAIDMKIHADFINKELCDARNEIAHGGGAAPSLEAFLRRRDRTFGLMSQLQTIVVNAAASGSYKAA